MKKIIVLIISLLLFIPSNTLADDITYNNDIEINDYYEEDYLYDVLDDATYDETENERSIVNEELTFSKWVVILVSTVIFTMGIIIGFVISLLVIKHGKRNDN